MAFTLKRLYTQLIFLIIIIEITGIYSNGTSPDENQRPGARGRIIKLHTGARPEPIICTSEGFVTDPHNCAMFYRCVKSGNNKYTVFRFQCGPGTIYDPDKEVCNHPQYTTRPECGGISPPFIHTTHINEIQGNTYNEIPSPMISSKPIYPSNTLQKSTIMNVKQTPPSYAENFTTKHYTTSTPASPYPLGSSINPINIDHNLHEMTVKPLSTISTVRHPISQGDICKSDGFMGDSENCRKFYRCVANQRGRFTRYEFMCSETTVWDDVNQICNHVWAVKRSRCGLYSGKVTNSNTKFTTEKWHTLEKNTMKPHIRENVINNTVQQQLQIGYGTKVTQTQTQIGNGFVEQNQTQINYGDRLNQNKNKGSKQNQTQISQGSAISQSQTQIDYGNKEVQTQLQIDHSKEASQTQIQMSETSTKKISTTIKQSENQEVNKPESTKCTEDGFIGDSNDCRKFYRCINNGQGGFKKFGFSCAEGTAWDLSIKSCNHIWAVKGCNLQGSIESSPHTVTTTTYRTTQKYQTTMSAKHTTPPTIEDNEDNDNTGYGISKPVLMPTPSSSTTITTVHNLNGTECTSNGFMGDDNDCKIFYRCVEDGNGGFTKHIFKCGEGTLWDPEIKACNHAWAVVKCGGNTSPNINRVETTTKRTITSSTISVQSTVPTHLPTVSSPDHEYDDNNLSGYGTSNNDFQSTTSSSKNPPILNQVNHICKSSGYIGDKYNCEKFYRCVDNGQGGFIPYEYTCSKGTLWDHKISACNYASAVDRCGEATNKPKEQNASNENVLETTKNTATSTPNVTTTISTTESISIGDKCKQSGFMGDSNDCKRFYRCVDDGNGSFIKHKFLCGEGTLWDQEIKSCNHAWAVTKCGANSGSSPLNDEFNHTYPSNGNTDSEISSTTTAFSTTTTATKQETAGELCVSSGFFGDTKQCEKFYRCVDNGKGGFVRYEYVCGEGTVWDQSLKACNHHWAVKECGRTINSTINKPSESTTEYSVILTTSLKYDDSSVTQNISEVICSKNDSSIICTKEGFKANPKNCKSFYRCVEDGNGGFTKHQYSCGEGTYWNQEILSCDHITANKTCELGHTSTTKLPQAQDEMIPEITTISRVESHGQKPTSKPVSTSVTCMSEGFYDDQYDCRKFYRCVNDGKGDYTIYYFNCGDGTSWDQELQTCNHESLGKCTNLTSGSLQTTENPSQQGSVSTTSEKYNTSSTSVQKCESEGFFAVPNDCNHYIRCVSNNQGGFIKHEFACSEGTVWVQEMLTCYHDTLEAYCNPQTVTKPVINEPHQQTTENYGPSSSEHSPGDNLNDENVNSPSRPPPTTSGICLSEGYYPNDKDCRRFYQCVDNGKGGFTKYDHNCGEGTAWDPNIQICNHIDRVSSCNGSVMHDEDNTQTTENSVTTTQGLTSSTTSTTTPSAHKPVNNSEHHSPDSNSQNTDTCASEGYFGNTQDCKKFYRCVNDGKGGFTKYDFICAEGTIWDKDVPICNHPEDVANPSCNQTNSISTTEDLTSSSSTTSTTESNQGQIETSKKPGNNNINCTKAGFYPDPNNCKKFYRCVDWDGNETKFSIFHFDCAEGTIWDPAVETCNHESSVYPPRNCSGSQPSVTESTTTTEKESTTKSSTQVTSESPTESTTTLTTQSTTTSTTQSTTPSTTESGTTESTTPSTTESGTTESTTPSTTESGTTESTTLSTTESGTTESTTPSTTESGTTESGAQTTTEQLEESTTAHSVESTTQQLAESTTEYSGSSTTEQSSESTTEQLRESTTEYSGENTTTHLGESTTEHSGESTTEYSGETTTDQLSESTTEQLGETTTEQSGESTTELSGESTTEQSIESTTEESIENTTTEGLGTDQTTTEKNGTTESASTEKPTGGDCPETENDQYLFVCPSSFRRHPKYCNLFYQCDENEDTHDLKIAVFTCPNNTIYDKNQTKCVNQNKAEKPCDGEISQKHRVKRKERIGHYVNDPLVVSDKSYGCTTTGYFAFEKEGDCSPGFLKCTLLKTNKLRGLVYRCPADYLFWNVSRRCEPVHKVSDCKRSLVNDWRRRWEIPIERKNVAW